ncbi:M56 family metallopeptidase [Actinomadura macrotermitis]|uniref:Protease HtpX n=1 Tax=Actinomadura macrotermitis TaxID=2585200 RepID=A0A7K0C3D3_9ACTN|nr:M56 family metallopeptidase [Actinomadura macrotermitis]MQY07886.1 Protease HtpX [Actinomadura macrotermitis]
MIGAVAALLAAAVLLGCSAGPVLDRPWRSAGPGAVAACWAAALAGTAVACAGVVAVALLAPPAPGHGLVEWLRDCLPHHRHGAVAAAAAASLALAAACAARLRRGLPRLGRAVRHRRRHREMLRLVAREHGRHPDVLVLDHPVPVAYSLPARERSIVVSTGAQRALTADELGAVLAHERAHLRRRHHALLLMLDLVHAVLPWSPTVRRAKARLPLLLELAADEAAVRAWGSQALAGALRRLAAAPGAAHALGAAGPGEGGLAERLLRLEAGVPDRPRRAARAAAWAFAAGAVVLPPAAAAVAILKLSAPC